LNFRFDSLLVFNMKHDVQAGLYSIAVSLAEMTQNVPNAMSAVLYPSVSGDVLNADMRTTRLTRMTTLILMISCVLLASLGYPLIGLFFGAQFRPAYLSMVMLLPGMISIGCARVIAADIVGRGYPKYSAIAAWIALGATLVLDLLLIPRWGILGAAFASSVAYTISVITLTVAYHRLTGIPVRDLFLPRKAEVIEMAGRLRQIVLRYREGRKGNTPTAE
jgi:O-antigen/teichoic acid export membrane protein